MSKWQAHFVREQSFFARSKNCDYIMLDCDADVIPDLPTYEW